MPKGKFMLSIGDEMNGKLVKLAGEHDITIQELLRAVIIPFYFKFSPFIEELTKQEMLVRKRLNTH